MMSKRFTLNLAIIILCSFLSQEIFALDPQRAINQYVHRSWTYNNGLPVHTINALLQTRDQILWLGTFSGLYRFDGIMFAQVPTNPDYPRSLESILSLLEDKNGRLWIGTAYRGLRYRSNKEILPYGLKEGFEDTQVLNLFEGNDGHLLIATSIGLYGYDGKNFVKLFSESNYISSVCQDAAGHTFVGTHDGVWLLDGTRILSHLNTTNGLPNSYVTSLYVDRHGFVWIGTADGLVRYINGSLKIFSAADGLSNSHINTIFQDSDDNLWVGTNKGLCRFANGKWSSFGESDGMASDNILSITEDHEGSLWVGTSEGLHQFYDGNIIAFTTKKGLADNDVSSIVETFDGKLYFFSINGANVSRFDGKQWKYYQTSVGPVYLAKDNSVWMGQNGFMLNFRGDNVIKYDTNDGIPPRWISAIAEDSLSVFFYSDHKGIFRIQNGKVYPYQFKAGNQYPPDEFVLCFYQQRNDLLWIGTSNGVVQYLNGSMKRFTVEDGLVGNRISSITEDKNGNIWISSVQGGITRYRDGKFSSYTMKEGLLVDVIYSIECDDNGNLWTGTPRGIQLIQAQSIKEVDEGKASSLKVRLFTIEDGMKSDECFGWWQPGVWKTKNGCLWFATRSGAVKIDPNNIRYNRELPNVIITSIFADQKKCSDGDTVVIKPGTGSLEIHYTAFSFLVPGRVLFEYKLEGYDKDWVKAGNRRIAYYTKLPPGEYRFLVRACNNDGFWNEKGTSILLSIQPFFYQTRWFWAIVLIIIVGSVVAIVKYRLWRHEKREKELEARVQEALANVKMLSGLIPICSVCKKIRNDSGYWDQLEAYIQSHADVKFSHGICPECAAKLYPKFRSNTENKDRDSLDSNEN